MFQEFKDFISRGNAIDLAIGVIIGLAFGAIVNSIVGDLLMPLIGIIIGGINFSGLSLKVGGAVLLYGNLIQAVINFLIIAFVLFLIVKSITKFKPKADVIPALTVQEQLLIEIRDLLRSQSGK